MRIIITNGKFKSTRIHNKKTSEIMNIILIEVDGEKKTNNIRILKNNKNTGDTQHNKDKNTKGK